MPDFIVVGVNHETAPLSIREKLVFDIRSSLEAGTLLIESGLAKEAVILSTCNRTELYCAGGDPISLLKRLADRKGICHDDLYSYIYINKDIAAVKHLMRVAAGLDSMILGEVEILGQVKKAYLLAANAGFVGKSLGRLFQTTFRVAKTVRHSTGIGFNPLSVASVAVGLPKLLFNNLEEVRVLLIGAGDLIRVTAGRLLKTGIRKISIANRTFSSAQKLAEACGGLALSLDSVPHSLQEVDVLLSATQSVLPLIGKGMVERAIRQRKNRPMLMIDLAVPRDIEPEVAELENVYLYTIDDLQSIAEENKRLRQDAALNAEKIIEVEAAKFIKSLKADVAFKVLTAFREKFNKIGELLLEEAIQDLKITQDPEKVLRHFAARITNRYLHEPTRQLRYAGLKNDKTLLALIEKLFELECYETIDTE
jgi:glutamyl-tRNA reductase